MLLVAVMSMAFTACSKKEDNKTDNTKQEQKSEEKKKKRKKKLQTKKLIEKFSLIHNMLRM